ncbi:helix-turn-helix domain-containing protein [Gynuella sp.]|uniref:helix-turn-helix domain-containing protein n=1 Tax=Gynuella sp. TaxID=2969146 RepID=UPI003D14E9CD
MHEDFPRNLRLLCSYYKSIAEVCRRLDVNRPQFNRYLNGTSKPSAHKMIRFCDFFGVEMHEIMLPHDQFQRLIKVRSRSQPDDAPELLELSHLQKLHQQGSEGLAKYLGYYFEHYQSMACPGKILRTLVRLEEREDKIYYQRTERLQEHPDDKIFHGIYLGMAYFLHDRIFMVDYESLTGNEITQTILFPSFKNRVSRLTGLKLGVSGSGERMPCCARVVYEHLGQSIDKLRALSMCGLYDQHSPEIDTALLNAISNNMSDDEWHFRARHFY